MNSLIEIICSPFKTCFTKEIPTQPTNCKRYSDLSPEQLEEIFHPLTSKKMNHIIKTVRFMDTHGKSHVYRRCSTNQ
jgi:hypothetical protein